MHSLLLTVQTILQSLQQTELQILDYIASHHTAFLDTILPVITTFANAGIGWVLIAIILTCIPKYRKAGLTMALALILCLLIGNLTLKPLIARPRPYSFFPEMTLLIAPLNDFSFPSGHTFASFASATALFLYYKKAGIIAYGFAAIIAFSRLYLYVHFPTDVLFGMLLGILSGMTAYAIITALFSHFPRKQ